MAASSSSSNDPSSLWPPIEEAKGRYDVLLSFRGQDTRKGFVSHLFRALKDRGIHTFQDDERLEKGKSIGPELHRAIDDSKIAIVVFSENYASSSWCLDELVKIVESEPRKLVFPVFYDVDPSDIRKQINAVGKALAKHVTTDDCKMKSWRKALTEAANYAGCDVRNFANGDESECIKAIVIKVFDELSRTIPNARKDLVGIERRANKVMSMMRMAESDKVRLVGIWGMGGAGKTTIATDIFHKLSNSYDSSCFLHIAAGERWDSEYLIGLQKTLLSKILKLDSVYISHMEEGMIMIKDKLRFMRVLIVVDNVDDDQQLESLGLEHDSFGNGSRVIITTRDNHFLHGVDESYEVDLLDENEAIQLFSWHAFRQSCPPENFVELSEQVVEYVKGLPLALKVLGSHLKGQSPEEWSVELSKLKQVPKNKIVSVLKISYDGLDDMEKTMFLDIAFFTDEVQRCRDDSKTVGTVLSYETDSLGIYSKAEVSVLLRKSLVSIENGKLTMHDMIREMGLNIIQKHHPHSRLLILESGGIDELTGRGQLEAVEGMVVWRSALTEEEDVIWMIKALRSMKRLRLLWLPSKERYFIGPEYLSNELQWIEWEGYPLDSLPHAFQGGKLVALIMRHSLIAELNTREQRLRRLRILDLSWSYNIRTTPDFSELPCLEELVLNNCDNMVKVHSSLGVHKKLRFVDLSDCWSLETLPERLEMESLKCLKLNMCNRLMQFSDIGRNMTALEKLDIADSGIKEMPDSIRHLSSLRRLDLGSVRELQNQYKILVFNFCFAQLTHLNLSNCNLQHLAIPKSCLPSLRELELGSNPMGELSISNDCFSSLRWLDLKDLGDCDVRIKPVFKQVRRDFSMVSLIVPDRHKPSVDWEAFRRVIRHRNSVLAVRADAREIPKWFKLQEFSEQSFCEVILQAPIHNSKLKGLALYFCIDSMGFYNPMRYVDMKYGFQKQDDMITSVRPWHILVHYIPISRECFQSCSSSSQAIDELCLLDARISGVVPGDRARAKWGIGLVYDEEPDRFDYNSDMIKVNPLSQDHDPSISGQLKVILCAPKVKVSMDRSHSFSSSQKDAGQRDLVHWTDRSHSLSTGSKSSTVTSDSLSPVRKGCKARFYSFSCCGKS